MQRVAVKLTSVLIPLACVALIGPSPAQAQALPYGPGYGYGYGGTSPYAANNPYYFNHPAAMNPAMMYSARATPVAAINYQAQDPADAPPADAPAPMPSGPIEEGTAGPVASTYDGYHGGHAAAPYYYGGYGPGGIGLHGGYGPYGDCYPAYDCQPHHCWLAGLLFGWLHPHKCYDHGCPPHSGYGPYGY